MLGADHGACEVRRLAAGLRRWLWPISGVLGLCLAVLLGGEAARFDAACAAVRADTLRLHIRAAGDSIAEQTDKLRVRDAVLELTGQLYAGAESAAEAKAIAARGLPALALRAHHALWQQGVRQPVSVYLAEEYFTVRQYENYTLPAGQYQAVCIEIGGGQGRNWWCCLYPQICLAACSGYEDENAQALVVGEYQIKFRLAEWWQELQQWAAGQCEPDPAAAPAGIVCTVE